MSITNKEILHCPCGYNHAVMIVKSLNAGRHPHLRDEVMRRELHRWDCPQCKRRLIVDSDFFWFDWHRKQFIGVFPTARRRDTAECDEQVRATFKTTLQEQAPAFVLKYADGFFVRTVFGVEELREKIVLHDAGLDDFILEMLKVELLTSYPVLIERGVVTLRLDSFLDDGSLVLFPEGQDGSLLGDPPLEIGARREVYDALLPHREELLRERSAVVGGSHISLRRLADAM